MPQNQNADAHPQSQAEFDLKRAIELFDAALISNDERVINALRSLLMIVTLTTPETGLAEVGPLRHMQHQLSDLEFRLKKIENMLAREYQARESLDDIKYRMQPNLTSIYDLDQISKILKSK